MLTNMAESEVECFSGIKTAQKRKAEGGIERKKHENVKLKEDVPGVILYLERKKKECTQNSKAEGGIERKNMKMCSWRKKMCLGQFYTLKENKKQKNTPWNSFRDDFFAGEPKQLDTSCLWYSIKCKTREFLKLFVQNDTQQLACLVIYSRWLLDLSPKQSHKCARALSLGPRLSLFSGVSYRRPLPNKLLLSNKRPLYAV